MILTSSGIENINIFIVEKAETILNWISNDAGGGDGGGELPQVNGETQDQLVSQDAEMEEGRLCSTINILLKNNCVRSSDVAINPYNIYR